MTTYDCQFAGAGQDAAGRDVGDRVADGRGLGVADGLGDTEGAGDTEGREVEDTGGTVATVAGVHVDVGD